MTFIKLRYVHKFIDSRRRQTVRFGARCANSRGGLADIDQLWPALAIAWRSACCFIPHSAAPMS
jgi:hypothetical protein